MTITFIHNNKAFLPEVHAYGRLFGSLGISCKTALPEEAEKTDTDVEWHFIGLDTRKSAEGRIKIHEYASGSIGRFRAFKDFSKKILNVKPDFRLFLNPYVKEKFDFTDDTPFGYRDMGVEADWLTPAGRLPGPYKYDFVYTGDLSPARRPEALLDVFATSLKEKTLLVISSNYARLQTKYAHHSNIVFKGPYGHAAVRSLLLEARYGVNYIIDREPFNRQTSTKFLEYAACGLPVISTRYKWIEEFGLKYGGKYFYLNPDLSNFTEKHIEDFKFSGPDLSDWTWEKQIRASGILEFLRAKFTGSSVSLSF